MNIDLQSYLNNAKQLSKAIEGSAFVTEDQLTHTYEVNTLEYKFDTQSELYVPNPKRLVAVYVDGKQAYPHITNA